MRISTQMFYESTKKAGIPVQTSLLDYINNKNKEVLTDSSVGSTNSSNELMTKYFDKTEKASGKLLDYLSVLSDEDRNSVWDKAEEAKDNKAAMNTVENMIEAYNNMYKNMQIAGGPLNEFYSIELQNTLKENTDALKEIGITFGKDGTLSIDKDVFGKADLQSIKKLFGGNSEFSKKLSIITNKVEDNARVSRESISSQYTANGNGINTNYNRYDFWG